MEANLTVEKMMIAVFPRQCPDEDLKSAATATVILELAGRPLIGVMKTFLR